MIDTNILKVDGTDITNEIEGILIKSLEKTFKNLKVLSLNDLTPNPYLMRLVGKVSERHTAEDLVEYLLNARLERSMSTSFGNTIQKIATAFAEETGVGGADISIVKEENGIPVRWYIQMKSGPNTVNRNICIQISQELQSAVRRAPGAAGLLGITYGKEERVSSVTQQYLSFDFKAGRDFWEFLSNDPDMYLKLWSIIINVSDNYQHESGQTLKELIEEKRINMIEEFLEMYGDEGSEMWDTFLDKNM